MFTLFFPSKRLRIAIRKGRVKEYFIFEQLFDLYEYGLLPLKESFNKRSLRVWRRRWREAFYMVRLFARVLFSGRDKEGLSSLVPRTTL
jgi:hypothetical protein